MKIQKCGGNNRLDIYMYCEIKNVLLLFGSNEQIRVSEYKSRDVSKEIYYSVPFLAFKMATVVHTGGKKAEPSVGLV